MTYYLGLVRGTGRVACWGNNHRKDTLVLDARRDKDYLSPDLWKYLGRGKATKASLRRNKAGLLAAFNKQYGTAFRCLIVD